MVLLLTVCLMVLLAVPVEAQILTQQQTSGNKTWTEVSVFGSKRYETACDVARQYAKERNAVPTRVVMAYGGDYPDALTASSLAGTLRCPILLVKRDTVPAAVQNLLKNDWHGNVSEYYFVGAGFNEAVIREQLTACSSAVNVMDFTSFAGSNRYVTAELVARYVKDRVGVTACALATGSSAADALSMSPWSYEYKIPILLTKADGSLRGTTRELIDSWRAEDAFKRVYILGGTSVIPAETEISFAPEVQRLSGNRRYETSLNVAQRFLEYESGKKDNFRNAVIVLGTDDSYADALVSGPLAGERDAALLLVRQTGLKGEMQTLIKSNIQNSQNYTLTLVGKAAGSESVRNAILTSLK